MTAPPLCDPADPADAVPAVAAPGAPGWHDESEAAQPDPATAAAGTAVRQAVRHVTRLARLKALVARFEERHLGHRVAMHVAHVHEDEGPHAAARWPDSFFDR